MCPELTKSVEFKTMSQLKFVRVKKTIVYGSYYDFHNSIAKDHFKELPDFNGRPIVDDAGTIETNTISGKPRFVDDSSSCHIDGNLQEARKITNEIAQSILGKNNVEV